MDSFETTDPRVRRIGETTWIDTDDKFVFEGQRGGVNAFNLRKGPGQMPPLNETLYPTLDDAIAAHLGALAP